MTRSPLLMVHRFRRSRWWMIRESTDAERRARQYLDGYLVAAIMGVTAPRVKKYLVHLGVVMTETERLSEQARRDYGDLVARIDTWPPGRWIEVHLTGDDSVKYLPDGTRYVVSQPSGRTRMRRAVAALRGWARNFDH